MDAAIFTVIGAVSGIAGLAGLFLALPTRRSKVVHFIYCAGIAALAGTTIYYQTKWDASEQFSKQAFRLKQSISSSDDRGFMLSALALLEKNKAQFPETYEAAKELCRSAGLTGAAASITTIEGVNAMFSLLHGLSLDKQ